MGNAKCEIFYFGKLLITHLGESGSAKTQKHIHDNYLFKNAQCQWDRSDIIMGGMPICLRFIMSNQ